MVYLIYIMAIFGFGKPRTQLGVDIGTSAIKIMELSKESGRLKLVNYGLFELENVDSAIQAHQKIQKLGDQDIIWALKETIKKSGIKGKDVVASIPSYSTFATVISMPYLSKEDIAKAIPFEARKYVPIPLDEVILDWSIVDVGKMQSNIARPPVVEVFLAAVPKDETRRYQTIFKEAGLNLKALELENMSLIRALVGNDRSPLAIVNLGGRSTTITVVDEGFERVSHNYEVGGFEITKSIARSMNIDLRRAEELKRKIGFKEVDSKIVNEAMVSLIDMIIFETRKTISRYENEKKVKISRILFIGGLTNMPHFMEYFKNKIGLDVEVGDPFSRLVYKDLLKPLTGKLGTVFAIAIGLAMREV